MKNAIDFVNFDESGLVPVITQDFEKGDVLMMAYMNRLALERTLETGNVHYFSRSRNRLWMKGETSGHLQKVRELFIDCDGDTILIKVDQKVAACHTGHYSCFYRKIGENELIEVSGKVFNEEKIYGE